MCEKALPFRCSSIRNSARLSLAVRARAPALPASSMTGRAACQNCGLLNVILLFQVHSFGDLVFSGSPFHLERISLRNHGHLIDPAVAGRTADAFVYMNRVIEISEVRKVVDANPFQ